MVNVAKKLEIGIVGLGKFGLQLGRTLTGMGHTVVGLDTGEARVRLAQDVLAQVYQANAADIAVLQQLRFQDLDIVFVSVGDSMETSLLVVLNLQELGAHKIGVKAASIEHRKVLTRLGVDLVILPEHDVATHVAHRLANPGMLDLLPLGGGVLVQELVVDKWAGRTLLDLKLVNDYGVMVVAVKSAGGKEYRFVPQAHETLDRGDALVVIGKQEDVLRLVP
ncbi:TrkA family potassium uptake protein [Nitratidesulfovibrio liaohensis]|uniref:TrkA family potassium uptake protein n=1 Tax=Nitratidesulfovibrio liaohensis TaxID=2604158 RepID=A0ABY9R6W3_9BACT|nr:TrkA family potassium uptake protein [Nitratidesulfovibrio liaohensis]NHZ46275.1 TrkA family potassium uptake protein [Nitratidesulfovibrio liaohensis]WMW67174.1 TrkA family potassium uptake protein [Nitratidesulfovibrio liaohensis]